MSSTKTVGYFNPNRWPVIVNISVVNVNVTVPPKGYVTDRDTGKKVNDPLLERFVGPDMLARETSKVDVPPVHFPRPAALISDAHHSSVAASSRIVKNDRGIVQDTSFDGVIARNTGVPNNGHDVAGHSVAVYTTREAVKRGIIRPVIIPDESRAPRETNDEPIRGDKLMPIQVARDATPREAKRLIAEGATHAEVPVELKPADPAPAATAVAAQEEPSQEDASVPDAPVLDVGAHLKALQAKMDVGMPAPSAPVPIAAPLAPPRQVPAGRPDRFICAEDGRSFKRKGYLLNHVRKHFPEKEKELMAAYADEVDD